ncbi:MAG: hypothetical protein RLZZ380_511 [Actinomycetota bacterium]
MAHLFTDTDNRLALYTRFPIGYPVGSPVAGSWQVPTLEISKSPITPTELIAFDDRNRAISPLNSAIHFYRDDQKFASVVRNPPSWVSRFSEFGFILTPDISLGDDMPSWMRQQITCISRAVGVIWQTRGMNVIPSLRWRSNDDLPFVTAGIPKGGTIAVSNYGSRREHSERIIFREGLEEVLQILSPNKVLLYGSTDANLQALLDSNTELHTFQSPIDLVRERDRSGEGDQSASLLF